MHELVLQPVWNWWLGLEDLHLWLIQRALNLYDPSCGWRAHIFFRLKPGWKAPEVCKLSMWLTKDVFQVSNIFNLLNNNYKLLKESNDARGVIGNIPVINLNEIKVRFLILCPRLWLTRDNRITRGTREHEVENFLSSFTHRTEVVSCWVKMDFLDKQFVFVEEAKAAFRHQLF